MSVSRTSPGLLGSSPRTDVTDRAEMAWASATPRDGSGCGSGGMPVAVARRIAERTHARQVDESGEPYIHHVGRVAAGVPLFARSVGWLHDVVERSTVDESALLGAGASLDECLALRLLIRDKGARSDDAYMEHVRVIALSPGVSGRIARAVKRADLLDHVAHCAVCSVGWPPPYGAALVVLMMVSANCQDAGPAWL